jgi:ribosome maturation factor RimP
MATAAGSSRLASTVRDIIAPIVVDDDVDLVEVEVKGPPNRRMVRVIADAVGGLDIDRIANISRQVGDALDQADAISGSWILEVTSPGVDRPLTHGRDFARQVGRDVRLVLADPEADEIVGTVVAATDTTVTLARDGADQTYPIADVDHGRVELPW